MSKTQKLFDAALARHRAGDAAGAETLYRELLGRNARHVDALNNLGVVLAMQGRLDEAVQSYETALRVQPDYVNLWCNLANALYEQDHVEQAAVHLWRAIEIAPDDPELNNNLGVILQAQDDIAAAAARFERALQLRPDYADAHANLGAACFAENHLEEAVAHFERALRLEPERPDTLNDLGDTLAKLDRHADAEERLRAALRFRLDFPEAHNNLGNALFRQHRFEEAEACYGRALDLRPDYTEARDNLGSVMQSTGRCREAIECHRQAIELDPGFVPAHDNLGTALRADHELEAALASYENALAIDPDHADAMWNRALCQLTAGDFERGWIGYEWRVAAGICTMPAYPLPRWDGSALDGRAILVHGEQGVGDEVMFASCLRDVIARSGRCIVDCEPRLAPLFARSFPGAEIRARDGDGRVAWVREAGPIEVCVPIGSLPRYFRPDLESFPQDGAYLAPDPEATTAWRERLAALGDGLKVGVSWRGGKPGKDRLARSTALEQWAALFAMPGVRFVNLQYGACDDELAAIRQSHGIEIADWDDADPLKDLDGFAAQVAALDLVVSIDNATVHMAGALGVPVWTMLPHAADWRWMAGRDSSPWYPSMTLFQQPDHGDWDRVFTAVQRALAACVEAPARLRQRPETPPAQRLHAVAAAPATGSDVAGRVAFVNDTSAWYHWGCTCTSTAIRQELGARGYEVAAVPIRQVYDCTGGPDSLAELDDAQVFARFRDANRAVIDRIAGADLVVVNGEGTLHGTGAAARNLLYLAYTAKTRLGKPVHIINHSCYPESAARISDVGANTLYKRVYEVVDFVAVREGISAALLSALGIDATLGFDCLPLFVARNDHAGRVERTDRVVIAGSAAWDGAVIATLKRYIEALAVDGLAVDVLVGAQAAPARDDKSFVAALRQSGADGWRLVTAGSAESWLDTIAGARLLVSGRFHHSIAAASLGTPFIAFNSNTPKMDGLMEMLGHEAPLAMDDENVLAALAQRTQAALDAPADGGSAAVLDRLATLGLRNFAGLDAGVERLNAAEA